MTGKYMKIEVGRLNQMWPSVNLVYLLNKLGPTKFTNNSILVLLQDRYIYDLNTLLGKTPRR